MHTNFFALILASLLTLTAHAQHGEQGEGAAESAAAPKQDYRCSDIKIVEANFENHSSRIHYSASKDLSDKPTRLTPEEGLQAQGCKGARLGKPSSNGAAIILPAGCEVKFVFGNTECTCRRNKCYSESTETAQAPHFKSGKSKSAR